MTTWEGRDPTTGRPVAVDVADGHIREVRTGRGTAADLPWLVPGFVDLQVNGYGGHDVNGPAVTPDTVRDLADALARRGTTTFVPTVITGPEDAIVTSLRAISRARAADPELARAVPFAHVEGPFIAEEDGPRGAHDLAQVRPPSLAELDRWQEASDGVVGMVTISPHHPGSVEFTTGAVARGVQVAVGHTSATPEQVRAVVDAGATVSTHLGNGAHATLSRHPNYIWAQLADDRLHAGFIADGHHLPADTLTAMLRAKGLDRSFLVSDSVALAGMPAGTYDTPVGGQVELSAEGRLVVAGTPYLAGAVRCLAECVAAALGMTGLPVADVVRLATTNPARLVLEHAAAAAARRRGPAARPGRVAAGLPADLLLLDPVTAEVREVVRGGTVLG